MASNFRFPILPIDELIAWLRVELQLEDLNLTEEDFKNPQPHRVQILYRRILESEMNIRQEKIIQPHFEAVQQISYPEFFDENISLINLAMVMARFMTACDVHDFKLKDLTCPKPKRTMRMVSAVANFCRFKTARLETYERIRADVDSVKEQHDHYLRRIDELKSQINTIKANQAEKEVFVKEMSAKVDELGTTMNGYKAEQASLQQGIHQIKTSCSEKTARLEQLKLNALKAREACNKLRPQIIQSPERIKTDMARMHNAIAAGKKATEEKGQRLRELSSQKENMLERCEAGEQGVKLLTAINTELEKQKDAKGEVEKVRDHILSQKDALRDLTAKEAQLNRQLESKQDKVAKVQLQHQRSKEDIREAITAMESNLASCSQKQQKKMDQISAIEDKKTQVRQQLAEAKNVHDDKMNTARANYSEMLQSIDVYHKDLIEAFEAANPITILGDH
ncbi:kinetochore protein Nuf2-like [Patiria miniata]|uniref:Kinetochore protein Nuf2 n=1 Tax=Patiria miniata TaxID=46514 RepID=A0A914AZI7_PATMI|nr:kinetochore protein Nuf2-like [Patiria miniata]